jgi:DivIVA domain-containing protein
VKKRGSTDQEAHPFGSSPSTASTLTPLDIQNKEFRVSRMGGYRMRDVDEFLDQITDSLNALLAENARLRESGAGGGAGISSEDEVADARREAERILREARERASLIEAGGSDVRPLASEDVAAVQAFLRKERDFLRSLGSLVQGHAEEMKGMAREARGQSAEAPAPAAAERPEAPEPAEPAEPPTPTPAPAPADESDPQATVAMSRDEMESDDPGPVHVGEPEPAGSRTPEDARSERSLRELFWGEES